MVWPGHYETGYKFASDFGRGSDRRPVYRSSPAAWRRANRFLNEAELTLGEGGCRLQQLRAHGWEHRATVWPWQAKCVPLAGASRFERLRELARSRRPILTGRPQQIGTLVLRCRFHLAAARSERINHGEASDRPIGSRPVRIGSPARLSNHRCDSCTQRVRTYHSLSLRACRAAGRLWCSRS